MQQTDIVIIGVQRAAGAASANARIKGDHEPALSSGKTAVILVGHAPQIAPNGALIHSSGIGKMPVRLLQGYDANV
jgi:hypothetical protein